MSSRAIAHLIREHRWFTKVLGGLSLMLDDIDQRKNPSRHDLCVLLEYLDDLSYLRHEEKEESLLMPALVRLGMDWEHGPIAEVRRDHREEHYLFTSMRHLASQVSRWSEDDRLHFMGVGRELLRFSAEHMLREERDLFPHAQRVMTPAVDQALLADFEAIDRDLDGAPESPALQREVTGVLRTYRAAAST